jgi:hypothetical protein
VTQPSGETTLTILHVTDSTPAAFQVIRASNEKDAYLALPPSPVGFPVEGRPGRDLMQELQWYLETFLNYPYPPETDHADRVLRSLKQWAEQVFKCLSGGTAITTDQSANKQDCTKLRLRISSDDPEILSWPWEALSDPNFGPSGRISQIERRLKSLLQPVSLQKSPTRDQVNILLVVARPYDNDVAFHSLARPLIEMVQKEQLPAHIELLRPPTFDQLREHLRERPNFYHILHFDGHGAYDAFPSKQNNGELNEKAKGVLVFETADGAPDPVSAEELSMSLRKMMWNIGTITASDYSGGRNHSPIYANPSP